MKLHILFYIMVGLCLISCAQEKAEESETFSISISNDSIKSGNSGLDSTGFNNFLNGLKNKAEKENTSSE